MKKYHEENREKLKAEKRENLRKWRKKPKEEIETRIVLDDDF